MNVGFRGFVFPALLCAGVIVAACAEDTAKEVVIPAASESVVATEPGSPSPSPSQVRATIPMVYPPGTETGNAAVDGVLAAIESGDPRQIMDVIRLTPRACVHEARGPDEVECKDGEPEGTMVGVLDGAICDADFYSEHNLERFAMNLLDRLGGGFSAAVLTARSDFTGARLIFGPPEYVWIEVEDGLIVHYAWGCGPNRQLIHPGDRLLIPTLGLPN